MRRIVLLTCIGGLALALTAFGGPKGKSTARSGGGHAARTAHVMSARGGAHPVSRPLARSHAGSNRMESAKIRSARTAERSSRPRASARSRTSANGQRTVARERNARNQRQAAATRNARNVARANARERSRSESARVRNERMARSTRAAAKNNLAGNRHRNLTFANNVLHNRAQNARITNYWRNNRFNNRSYAAFYNYNRQWHDRNWWHNHYSNIVFVLGGWWYWNAGYWYPAWGYDPYGWYAYDGPIYTGYASLTPDQVIINVQVALQNQGYYVGAADGVMGPETRAALAAYQADNGLAVTSTIDSPTLTTLGIA